MADQNQLLACCGLLLCACSLLLIKYQEERDERRRLSRFKSRHRRIESIRRISEKRSENHQHYELMKSWDAPQFFKYTRMTVPVFEKLLKKVKSKIGEQSDGISSVERLVITLQYLSQGTSMQELSWGFDTDLTTVSKIIHEMCLVIWETLNDGYMRTRDPEGWRLMESYSSCKLPHCLGALDGKLINIQAPANSDPLSCSNKENSNVVLLATCDNLYHFTSVETVACGPKNDGNIFKNSILGQRLEEADTHFPSASNLPDSDVNVPYFFVANESFPLKAQIMRPYPSKNNLTDKQKLFNNRLSGVRQVIENTFGILVARWKVLKTKIKAEDVDSIVKAVTVLHNYCKIENVKDENMYCPPGFVDSGNEENGAWRNEEMPLLSVGRVGSNMAPRKVFAIRDALADYLVLKNDQVLTPINAAKRRKLMR